MTHRVVMQDAFKRFTLDQDKILPPEATVKRFREKLKGADLDILESTIRIDNGRLDIPVFFSVCGPDARKIIGTRKQMGKGGTPEQAEASAVMELAERFSFFSFYKNPENFFVDTYRNCRDRALPFESIVSSVHDSSNDLNKAHEIFSDLPLKWTWAYNMTRDKEVLVPFNWFFAINEYNGPSAGNCVEEALSQGLCEIVERHVSSIVSLNSLRLPAINLSSVTDPLVLEMLRKYRKAGVELFAHDFSLDTGIPTIGVLAYDPATFPERSEIVWTAGTTPGPEKALSRALTEVAQLGGDFNTGSNYVASGLPKFRSLEDAKFLIEASGTKDISDLPDLSHDNIRVEVENCIGALSRIGMDVIVVDVMHPKLQIPAFYTIIPGAHFRERAAGTSVGMFCAKLVAESGDPRWAAGQLRAMDDFMPGKYYVKFFLGSAYLAMNERLRALRYFEEALSLDPKEEEIASIYAYMGICLKDMGEYEKAITVLEKAKEFDDERTDIYNLMGFCHFKLKEHEKAIACFKNVLRLDPGSAIDYANIASNYRDMGNREQAVRYYEFALDLDPTIEFAKENLSRLQNGVS